MKMPNLASSPEMVPTSESCGCSGSFGLGGAATFATVMADGRGAGGRRGGKKIGRSRVTLNCFTGISHSGLALSGRSAAGAPGVDGGMVTSTTVVVGSLQIEGTEAFGFASSASSSNEESETAVAADAPTYNGSARTRVRIASLHIITYLPATVRRRRAETAACL